MRQPQYFTTNHSAGDFGMYDRLVDTDNGTITKLVHHHSSTQRSCEKNGNPVTGSIHETRVC